MNIAYARISTTEQNIERQLVALEKYNIDKWYTEKVSAKDTKREKLNEMLDFAREGDTVYILDFSRIARNTVDLLQLVNELDKKNINLISLKENIDTNTASGKLMLTMLGAIYEFERTNLLERQKEGIALAKLKGKYKGRKETRVDDFENHYNDYINRKINKTQLAKNLNISRPTLNKLIAIHVKTK